MIGREYEPRQSCGRSDYNPTDMSHGGSRAGSSSQYFTAYSGALALSRYPCQQQNTALPSVFITLVARQLHRAKVGNVTVNTSLRHLYMSLINNRKFKRDTNILPEP